MKISSLANRYISIAQSAIVTATNSHKSQITPEKQNITYFFLLIIILTKHHLMSQIKSLCNYRYATNVSPGDITGSNLDSHSIVIWRLNTQTITNT